MSKFEFKSPGVQTREIDQSVIAPDAPEMGPIIIGRTRRGPAAIPASIDNLDNYNEIFGKPVPGMAGGDVWRNGITGPTYAAYAAQAWLASETTPINVVRLLGEQDPSASVSTGKAGWAADNAYGLFIMNSADNTASGETTAHSGTLAAVFYTTKDGSIIRPVSLSGSIAAEPTAIAAKSVLTSPTTIVTGAHTKTLTVTLAGTLIFTLTMENGGTFAAAPTADSATAHTLIGTSGETNTTIMAAIAHVLNQAVGVSAASAGATSITVTADTIGIGNPVVIAGTMIDDGHFAVTNTGATELTSNGLTEVILPTGAGFEYVLSVQDNSLTGNETETITFNFNRNSANYIRNVLNTDPTLTNTTITPTTKRKSYWLGETFERNLKAVVTGSTSLLNQAVMLPLMNVANDWADHKEEFKYARSGWFLSQDFSAATSGTVHGNFAYDASTTEKLFRCVALGGGEADNNNFMIAIKDLKLPSNPTVNGYGSFTLNVVSLSGNILESFTNLNFDPTSADFILRRVGDQYLEWNNDLRKYEVNAETQYLNVSSYIRIEMYGGQESLPSRQNSLPFGFLGPVRPKTISALASGSNGALANAWVTTASVAVYGSGSQGSTILNHGDVVDFKADLTFPSLSLRHSGSDGLNAKPAKAYWGIQPTISSGSKTIDSDYIDYVRPIGTSSVVNYGSADLVATSDAKYEYSFVFSLDNVVLTTSTANEWYHSGSTLAGTAAGSRHAGTSYSAINGHQKLLDAGVSRFYAPMHGGFDGLDITEQEPFGNHIDKTSDMTSYVRYTLHKALAAVDDQEVVPANMLLIPGQQETVITDQIVATAEDRQDLLAIIDLENDYTPATEGLASARGSVSTAISSFNNRTNINSSYGCAFYPAVQVADTDNGQYVWVPSSVAAVGAMAQSQKSAELWFAPAGFNRGGLGALGGPKGPVVIQARQKLDSSQRDDLYEVNINPIASFPNEGVVIFGQKTLQQTKSALDRINVRRLMIFLKKDISDIAKLALFEQNNSSTRAQLKFQITNILSSVKSRFGLSAYDVVLDERNNTADDIDNNRLNVSIFVKPTRAIEFIAIDFIITRSGVEFAE